MKYLISTSSWPPVETKNSCKVLLFSASWLILLCTWGYLLKHCWYKLREKGLITKEYKVTQMHLDFVFFDFSTLSIKLFNSGTKLFWALVSNVVMLVILLIIVCPCVCINYIDDQPSRYRAQKTTPARARRTIIKAYLRTTKQDPQGSPPAEPNVTADIPTAHRTIPQNSFLRYFASFKRWVENTYSTLPCSFLSLEPSCWESIL